MGRVGILTFPTLSERAAHDWRSWIQGQFMSQKRPSDNAEDRYNKISHKNISDGDVESLENADSAMSDRGDLTWSQRYTSGWRAGACLSCILASTVLLINVIVVIWTVSNFHMNDGIGILYEGSCSKAKSLNTWLQLWINILCTLLLGASNYCMQCLNSPTREEVNTAHRQRRLLRIGVPSIRNLRYVGRDRMLLWLSLGLSALPLHFL